MVFMFGGLLVAMAGKLAELRWLTFTGAFIKVVGLFCMAAYGMVQQSRPRRSRKPFRTVQPAELSKADTTNKLLPIGDDDFIPSVTERTTNLLEVPAARDEAH